MACRIDAWTSRWENRALLRADEMGDRGVGSSITSSTTSSGTDSGSLKMVKRLFVEGVGRKSSLAGLVILGCRGGGAVRRIMPSRDGLGDEDVLRSPCSMVVGGRVPESERGDSVRPCL